MEDRRINRRVRMVSHLEITFKGNGTHVNAFSTNLSRNGVGFCTGKEIKANQEVEIKMYFENSGDHKIMENIPCRIQWVKQISRIYEAGAQFLSSDLKDYPVLAKHIPHMEP
ncbi:MAG: PilZ domain-containing protein [Nitrospirae bacterium]|nr:PilZ domain-containing protein [Nitrospirota bacterium]